jgi:hypothetical protein
MVAAEAAKREALRNAPLETVLARPDHIGDTTQMIEEPARLASPGVAAQIVSPSGMAHLITEAPPAAAPPGASQAHTAQAPTHAHARAHEGVVLDKAEFAGLMDAPVPFDTPATARYRGLHHEATPATEAQVMALRYAGQNDEEIALYLRVSMETLYRCYRVTMAEAHAQMSGKLAIRMATMGLAGDFKAAKFIAEKRLRGFGSADKPFTAVRDNSGPLDLSVTARGVMGQSAAAIANRRQTREPEPDEDGIIEMEMVLGVPERPLSADGYELTDEQIAAEKLARETGLA